jgi:hypothetical protein
MSLTVQYQFNHNGVRLKSGKMYTFSYTGYEHDPSPLILFLNAVHGIHPKTGHQHRYVQGINLNYVPRNQRQVFVDDWYRTNYNSNGNMQISWAQLKARWPYLELFIRRYLTKPNYYIRGLAAISDEDVQGEVIGSFIKDYSRYLKRRLYAGYRQIQHSGRGR